MVHVPQTSKIKKTKKLKEYKIIQTPCNISTNVKLQFLLKDQKSWLLRSPGYVHLLMSYCIELVNEILRVYAVAKL